MKLSFNKIGQKDVLLLYPLKLSSIKSSFYFDNKEINLKYIIKALIKYLRNFFLNHISFRNAYFNTIVEQVNPVLAIGHDQDGRIKKFKKHFPKKISMMFQYGAIHNVWKKYFNKFWGNQTVDFFIVFNKASHRKLKSIKKLDCKYLYFGSLRNNEASIKIKKKKYDLMFISDYRDTFGEGIYDLEIKNQKFNKLLLKVIADYCIQRKKKIIVSLVSNRKEKKNWNFLKNLNFRIREKNYYQNISKIFQFNNLNSYECISESRIAICSASTLGLELISRNEKVYFLDGYYNVRKNDYSINKKKIFKDLDKAFKTKKKTFIKKTKKENLIIYDKNNNEFQKYLKKLIYERKKTF